MQDEGLLLGLQLDGQGGASAISWDKAAVCYQRHLPHWLHLDRHRQDAQDWVRHHSGLPTLAVKALLAEETRPRCQGIGHGLLLIVRGVNLNPGADPDDMVSLRLWIEGDRLISVRRRRLLAVEDSRAALQDGRGAHTVGALVAALIERLSGHMEPVIEALEDEVDACESAANLSHDRTMLTRLRDLRQQAIVLRRYVAPQREALARLLTLEHSALSEMNRDSLRETVDQVTRYVESLDAVLERAKILQDDVGNQLAETLNSRMYVLTLATGLFLPLTFITGLLGINVGGIPLAGSPLGFTVVAGGLAGLALLEVWLFHRLRWI